GRDGRSSPPAPRGSRTRGRPVLFSGASRPPCSEPTVESGALKRDASPWRAALSEPSRALHAEALEPVPYERQIRLDPSPPSAKLGLERLRRTHSVAGPSVLHDSSSREDPMADSGATMPDGKRISTGCAGLDDILDGGLDRDRMYLVEGRPGTGKTT